MKHASPEGKHMYTTTSGKPKTTNGWSPNWWATNGTTTSCRSTSYGTLVNAPGNLTQRVRISKHWTGTSNFEVSRTGDRCRDQPGMASCRIRQARRGKSRKTGNVEVNHEQQHSKQASGHANVGIPGPSHEGPWAHDNKHTRGSARGHRQDSARWHRQDSARRHNGRHEGSSGPNAGGPRRGAGRARRLEVAKATTRRVDGAVGVHARHRRRPRVGLPDL